MTRANLAYLISPRCWNLFAILTFVSQGGAWSPLIIVHTVGFKGLGYYKNPCLQYIKGPAAL